MRVEEGRSTPVGAAEPRPSSTVGGDGGQAAVIPARSAHPHPLLSSPRDGFAYAFGPTWATRVSTSIGMVVYLILALILLNGDPYWGGPWEGWSSWAG